MKNAPVENIARGVSLVGRGREDDQRTLGRRREILTQRHELEWKCLSVLTVTTDLKNDARFGSEKSWYTLFLWPAVRYCSVASVFVTVLARALYISALGARQNRNNGAPRVQEH
jgi:hypothetical protein